ncbi:MAG TPA: GNAT family N-acetyltransferase [Nitrososphaerales archaeon]|nr:GNAT family N-acetyltransferase [Nitrososphaerales archaeon]
MSRSGETIAIRDFRKSDLEDLLELLPRCFAQEFEVTGFDPDHARDMVNQTFGRRARLLFSFLRVFGREPIKFLVAASGNRVIGTTMVSSQGRVAYISTVMVHPDYRRRGVATALVRSALDYVRRRRMSRAVLHVVSTNSPAYGVYSKLGFKEFERVVNMLGDTASIATGSKPGDVMSRPYRQGDEDEVCDLVRASEDPEHMRVFEFSKRDLRPLFWFRSFHIATQTRYVSVQDGKIVGSVLATYTTPKETGSIGTLYVSPSDRSRGVEEALVDAAVNEMRGSGIGRVRAVVSANRKELIVLLKHLGFSESITLAGMSREAQGS